MRNTACELNMFNILEVIVVFIKSPEKHMQGRATKNLASFTRKTI